jgi:hypothetical protein
MSKTRSILATAALLLFVGSYVACRNGGANNPQACCPHADAWTFLDYFGTGLLLAALGLTLSAVRLYRENNKD